MFIHWVFRSILQLHATAWLRTEDEILVGGQAVMEGVMMRAPHSYCVAVRHASGAIVTDEMAVSKVSEKYPVFKYPVLRGVGALGQAMYLGIKALRYSANVAVAKEPTSGKREEISPWVMGLNFAFSFAFFVFLYKFVPLYMTTYLGKWFPVVEGRFIFNLTDGVIRLLLFLGFLYGISRWKEIRRVFEYHGAEHKVVANFESGLEVSVDNARMFSTLHPRCGTSFLLVVMVVAILAYALIPFESFWAKFVLRILLLPVIAGVSYEMIRLAAKNRGSWLAVLTRPGLWLQRITTQPPDDRQLEVAVRALQGAMALEQAQGGRLVLA
ncbi:MAG: DUF1385 domain-containing protein [Bryobacteraceae bacterium]